MPKIGSKFLHRSWTVVKLSGFLIGDYFSKTLAQKNRFIFLIKVSGAKSKTQPSSSTG